MPKGRYFSLGRNNKAFNSGEISQQVRKSAEKSFELLLNNEIFFVVSDLETLLQDIGEKTPNRGRGFLAARYNAPINFGNSPVQVIKRVNPTTGQYSASIRVLNDKFNMLDLGVPVRTATGDKPMRFPRYSRARTEANSLDIKTTNILDNRSQTRRSQASSDLFGPNRGRAVPAVIAGWITTTEVSAIPARNFMLTIIRNIRKRGTSFVKARVRKG